MAPAVRRTARDAATHAHRESCAARTEYVGGQHGLQVASLVWPQQLQNAASRHYDLLGFVGREVAIDGHLH